MSVLDKYDYIRDIPDEEFDTIDDSELMESLLDESAMLNILVQQTAKLDCTCANCLASSLPSLTESQVNNLLEIANQASIKGVKPCDSLT